MKAAPNNAGRLSLPVAVTVAVFTLALTLVSLQRAYAVVTVPNATRYSFSIGASSTTGSYAWPTTNYPLYIAGTTYTVGYRGTGNVTAAYATSSPAIASWSGVHADGSANTTAQGWTSASNVKIVETGFANSTQLETGVSVGYWRIRNNTTAVKSVTVLVIW
jgi:hypothetical protein